MDANHAVGSRRETQIGIPDPAARRQRAEEARGKNTRVDGLIDRPLVVRDEGLHAVRVRDGVRNSLRVADCVFFVSEALGGPYVFRSAALRHVVQSVKQILLASYATALAVADAVPSAHYLRRGGWRRVLGGLVPHLLRTQTSRRRRGEGVVAPPTIAGALPVRSAAVWRG